jgi:hypothetical protein
LSSTIDRALIQSYLETEYIIRMHPQIVLRIGQRNNELAEFQLARKIQSSGFLTACNPYSRACGDTENVERQQQLKFRLERDGFCTLPGVGRHPSNCWPGEESFLVPGLSLEQALSFGSEFEQNAVVWMGRDAVPELIVLR